jgi:preprotein translocase subunit SecE
MNTFFYQEQKASKFFLFLYPILAIAKTISWYNSREMLDLFLAILFTVITIFAFFGMRKKAKSYLTIDEKGIEWIYDTMNSPIQIPQEEIKWIKFENEGVSIYQESSFREFISFKNLKPEDQESVKQLWDNYPKGS